MIAGLLCILAAIGLVVYNLRTDSMAGNQSAKIVEKINQIAQEKEQSEKIDYSVASNAEMPEVTVDGNRYIGRIDIPDLAVSLPVMTDWSYPKLKIAPCRYKGSAYTDDLIIAAHNYRSHFGRLKSLDIGAKATFTDVDNNKFEYELIGIEMLSNTDTEKMEAGEWDLTLFTCTYGGAERITARFQKVEK